MWVTETGKLYYGDKRVGFNDREATQLEIDNYNLNKVKIARIEELRVYLNSTDYITLRHLGEKARNIQTTLTEENYLAIEQNRTNARIEINELETTVR